MTSFLGSWRRSSSPTGPASSRSQRALELQPRLSNRPCHAARPRTAQRVLRDPRCGDGPEASGARRLEHDRSRRRAWDRPLLSRGTGDRRGVHVPVHVPMGSVTDVIATDSAGPDLWAEIAEEVHAKRAP